MTNYYDSLEILRITVTLKTHSISQSCIFSYNQPADWRDIPIITYMFPNLKEKYLLAKFKWKTRIK